MHGFQARGVQVVEELFPGLVAELVEAGASKIGDLSEAHFRVGGHLLSQRPTDRAGPAGERPYLEYRVRSRVEALPNVRFRDCLEVAGLMHESACDGGDAVVTGVRRVVPPGGGAEDEVLADLVVDASGRGSRTPAWLEEAGYERPAEERIAVRSVRRARRSTWTPAAGRRFVIEGRGPGRDFGVALFGVCRARDLDLHGDGRREGLPGRPAASGCSWWPRSCCRTGRWTSCTPPSHWAGS